MSQVSRSLRHARIRIDTPPNRGALLIATLVALASLLVVSLPAGVQVPAAAA